MLWSLRSFVMGYLIPGFFAINLTLGAMIYGENRWLITRVVGIIAAVYWEIKIHITKKIYLFSDPSSFSWRNITFLNGFTLGFMTVSTAVDGSIK